MKMTGLTLKDKTVWHPLHEDMEQWKAAYPNLDINQQLAMMAAWTEANPTKRKTPRGIRRFVVSWLSRSASKPQMSNTSTRARSLQEDLTDTSWAD